MRNLASATRIWLGTVKRLENGVLASCAKLSEALTHTETQDVPPFQQFESWLKALATCGEMIEYRFGPQQMRLAFGTKEEMEQVLGELMTAWWSDIEIGFYEDRGPTYVITFKINNK